MRTRFAPSPTGSLHVGGLRTALYSYILAKQSKGKFLLRIEDTDQERSVGGAVEEIIQGLTWAGITPEEGVLLQGDAVMQKGSKGPYIQSERKAQGIYQKYAEDLLAKGHAYRCFCTPARLEEMRKAQEVRQQPPMYDRLCLKLSAEEIAQNMKEGVPHVIRMNVPHERTIKFEDDIRGLVQFQGHTIDDQVLLKSDGFPTYHLAHVVDDHLMEIDLVLRGEEWLSSLPKHLLLFEYLEWQTPRYAHVPLLLNKDKTKLSKRQNAVSVEEYIDKGYLPEALVNFLALLGWNPGTTQEMFTLQELIDQFSLERVQKSGAVFDLEKLEWLQGQWMRKIPLEEFAKRIQPLVADHMAAAKDDPDFAKKAALIQERITFFKEAPEMLKFFYEEPKPAIDLLANPKQKVKEELLPVILQFLIQTLQSIPENEWRLDVLTSVLLSANFSQIAEKEKMPDYSENSEFLGKRQYMWVLRTALTGLPYSPGATEVAVALGKEETLRRLHNTAKMIALS